ncbi:MAG: transposase, partial [Opitutaceae bacterium]|nr:transposase [Opitutaceae bacterium]
CHADHGTGGEARPERRSTEAVTHIGLDEKSFGRGQDYVSLMTDLKNRRVLEVVPGRSTTDAIALLETLPADQRQAVVAAAMDMGANPAAATKKACPQAAIVHDRFHVSMHLNEAVDKVRRQEHRRLLEEGDTSLTGTQVPLAARGRARGRTRALTFDELCERNPSRPRGPGPTRRPPSRSGARRAPSAATASSRSGTTQRPAANSSRSRRWPACSRPICSTTQLLRPPRDQRDHRRLQFPHPSHYADARGFRSFANYRIRILFHCGKLDLRPVLTPQS